MSKKCIKCGEILPEDASFCPYCTTVQIEKKEIKTPRKWRKKAVIGVAVLAVVAVIGIAFSIYHRPEIYEGGLLTTAESKQIARQLCSALWVFHSMGVVHRDVKPDNVIIRGKEAVLIDFDASRIYKSTIQEDTQILGTTGFAAPEQYGLSQSDGRADIYALGVLLNIMLTGEHPSRKLAGGRMGRIVQRCTMVNPAKRYKNILHLMEVL